MKPSHLMKGLLSVGLGLIVLQAGPARAGQLGVNPVQLRLDADAASEMLALRNAGNTEVRYEIRAYAWTEPPEGEPQLTPTDDVAVFPPVLEIAAGETRNVRVGTLVPPGAVERTYRIILEELPPAVKPDGVQFLNRLSIPVFVSPLSPHVATSIEAGRNARIELRNTGTVHIKPRAVSARAVDAKGAAVAEKSWAGWYVLPGGERTYQVPMPAGACARVRSIEVTVRADDGDHREVVATPQGACGT